MKMRQVREVCLILSVASNGFPCFSQIKAIITLSNDKVPLIATIGRRYRSLISRYVESSAESSAACSAVSTPTHSAGKSVPPADVDNHIHCLLWRAKNWT